MYLVKIVLILILVIFHAPLFVAAQGASSIRNEGAASATSSTATAEAAPRDVGTNPAETASSGENPKPTSSPPPPSQSAVHAAPAQTLESISPIPAASTEVATSNAESEPIPFKVFAAIAGVLALAGIGGYVLKEKGQNKKENNEKDRGCFNLKKLMDDKLKELTDVRGQLKGMAKAKICEGVRETIKDTSAGELLALAEKLEKEYGRLKKLFEDCIIDAGKVKKIILVDAVFCFLIKQKGNFEISREMHEMLETFKNRKILLTGADDVQFKMWNLDKMPYEVFTLKHNPEKTDPEYFKTLLKKLNMSKNNVVYFEHNPEAVKSAQSIGIAAYHYDNEKKDLKSLKEFLNERL